MRFNPYSATGSWTDFLRTSRPREHAVQLYSAIDELVEPVVEYLAAGFDRGEPAVVVATAAHRHLFAARLAERGWDETTLVGEGLLESRDAAETLEALLVAGHPSADRFERIIGGLIDAVAKRVPRRQVRAFGEMVDVLVARGEREAAAELEDLWNRLTERRRFSLLCAYHIDLFDPELQLSLMPQICGAHTHVQPGGDVARLGRAVGAALEEELGRDAATVYAQLPRAVGRSVLLPAPERALMWVSTNMPARAERILASARERYALTD